METEITLLIVFILLFFSIIQLGLNVFLLERMWRVTTLLKKHLPEKDADIPAEPLPPEPETQSVIYPEITEEPEISEKQAQKPSVIADFWRWFCIGSSKEGVSVEYAAATTWLMRAGILVLLCGVGFFLKYSIENNLVSPTVRIILTFLAGMGMFGAGVFGIGKRFHILAIGVLAAGVVTLYMGSFAGFKLYGLLPAAAAFLLMVLTTAAAMTVSVKLNLLPVALIGCTGAYLTPLMLSDGSGNLPFLAGYIAMISAGLLYAAREHRWRSLETLSFFLSFSILLGGTQTLPEKINGACILFLLVNFAVFSAIPLIRKPQFSFGLMEWLLPLGAAAFTLWTGIFMLEHLHGVPNAAEAGFALLISAGTLGEGVWLARKRQNGTKLLPAFLCTAVFSLALAFPLALNDHTSTSTAWEVLALVLVLAYTRSSQKTLLYLSLPTFVAAVLAGMPELNSNISDVLLRFFQLGFLALTLTAAGMLLQKYPLGWKEEKCFKKIYFTCGGILLFFYTTSEVYIQVENSSWYGFRYGAISVWWAIAAAGILAWGIRKNIKPLRISGLLLFALCLGKICLVDISGLNTLYKVFAFLLSGILFLGGATAYIFYRRRFSGENK